MAELDETGLPVKRYLWGAEVDQLLAEETVDLANRTAAGDVAWPLADHQNTIRDWATQNAQGVTSVEDHVKYDPFGNIDATDVEAAADHLFAYTARPWDPATGLQNNLNRWYDASTGRWLSEDPVGFEAGDVNLYRYCGNDAVNGVDPEGTEWVQINGRWWYQHRNGAKFIGANLFWTHYECAEGEDLVLNRFPFMMEKLKSHPLPIAAEKKLNQAVLMDAVDYVLQQNGESGRIPASFFFATIKGESQPKYVANANFGAPRTGSKLETAAGAPLDFVGGYALPTTSTSLYALGNTTIGTFGQIDWTSSLDSQGNRKVVITAYLDYYLMDSFEDPWDVVNLSKGSSWDPTGTPYAIKAAWKRIPYPLWVIRTSKPNGPEGSDLDVSFVVGKGPPASAKPLDELEVELNRIAKAREAVIREEYYARESRIERRGRPASGIMDALRTFFDIDSWLHNIGGF